MSYNNYIVFFFFFFFFQFVRLGHLLRVSTTDREGKVLHLIAKAALKVRIITLFSLKGNTHKILSTSDVQDTYKLNILVQVLSNSIKK